MYCLLGDATNYMVFKSLNGTPYPIFYGSQFFDFVKRFKMEEKKFEYSDEHKRVMNIIYDKPVYPEVWKSSENPKNRIMYFDDGE